MNRELCRSLHPSGTVISGHEGANWQCLLFPQKRTLPGASWMSALCQKWTLNPPIARHGIKRPVSWHAFEGVNTSVHELQPLWAQSFPLHIPDNRTLRPKSTQRRTTGRRPGNCGKQMGEWCCGFCDRHILLRIRQLPILSPEINCCLE